MLNRSVFQIFTWKEQEFDPAGANIASDSKTEGCELGKEEIAHC